MTRWDEKRIEKQQTAMFDVILDRVVPTMDPARRTEDDEIERKADRKTQNGPPEGEPNRVP